MSESTAVQPAVMTEREKFEAWAHSRRMNTVQWDSDTGPYYAHASTHDAWQAWQAAIASMQGERELMERDAARYAELAEMAKVAWRAVCDAEAVINTIDGEDVLESINLQELRGRLGSVAVTLFCLLGLPTTEFRTAAIRSSEEGERT